MKVAYFLCFFGLLQILNVRTATLTRRAEDLTEALKENHEYGLEKESEELEGNEKYPEHVRIIREEKEDDGDMSLPSLDYYDLRHLFPKYLVPGTEMIMKTSQVPQRIGKYGSISAYCWTDSDFSKIVWFAEILRDNKNLEELKNNRNLINELFRFSGVSEKHVNRIYSGWTCIKNEGTHWMIFDKVNKALYFILHTICEPNCLSQIQELGSDILKILKNPMPVRAEDLPKEYKKDEEDEEDKIVLEDFSYMYGEYFEPGTQMRRRISPDQLRIGKNESTSAYCWTHSDFRKVVRFAKKLRNNQNPAKLKHNRRLIKELLRSNGGTNVIGALEPRLICIDYSSHHHRVHKAVNDALNIIVNGKCEPNECVSKIQEQGKIILEVLKNRIRV